MSILGDLSSILMMNSKDIIRFSRTAPYRYKTYYISKRNSLEKRLIAHPSKELKFIQRIIRKILEKKLPIHESVFSYQKGIGIKQNAEKHRYNTFLLKMDLKDFFPSIDPELLFHHLELHNIKFDLEDKVLLSGIIFRKPYRNSVSLELSIGAPTSPLISNFIMYSFDKEISEICNQLGVVYTRYADDLTFSTMKKGVLFSLCKIVESKLNDIYKGRLIINNNKTVLSSKAHNRHVTGITLSNDNELSIGRNKKRILSSMIHYYMSGKLNDENVLKLQGELAFAFYIEPKFKGRLINKYGEDMLLLFRKN